MHPTNSFGILLPLVLAPKPPVVIPTNVPTTKPPHCTHQPTRSNFEWEITAIPSWTMNSSISIRGPLLQAAAVAAKRREEKLKKERSPSVKEQRMGWRSFMDRYKCRNEYTRHLRTS
mmetsp:Transcript_22568/g.62729  ORF Transcript_22568/g.62729 Transcript_22568/m.62729 type:complete len:117 (+) Transcript_22568:131-481(+)